MAEHTTVVKLHDWLKEQQFPTAGRAEKILQWGMRKSPMLKKIFTHISRNKKVHFWGAVILGLPSLTMISGIAMSTFLKNTAFEMLPMYCMVAVFLPYIISFMFNLRWKSAIENLMASDSAQIENVLKTCDRVAVYHPELLELLEQVRQHLTCGVSSFQTQNLQQILFDILTQTPLNISVETLQSTTPHLFSQHIYKGLKSLIHYPQFRKIATICDALRDHKPTLFQKIFSPGFLKNSDVHLFGFCSCFLIGPFLGFVLLTETLNHPLSVLSIFPIVLIVYRWVAPYLSKSLLASDSDKAKIVEKCHKILSLYPQTNEIIVPLLEHLKHDVSIGNLSHLEPELNDILINLGSDGIVPQALSVEVENLGPCVTPQRTQRLVV